MKELLLLPAHILGWAALLALPMIGAAYALAVPITDETAAAIVGGVIGIAFGSAAVLLGNITYFRWLLRQPIR